MMKHQFELIIKSSTSDVVLKYEPSIRKWRAISLADMKILATRKNVEALIAAINGTEAA